MYFDGDGDYLSIPDSDDWDFGSEDFTIDFWLNLSDTNTNAIVGQWDNNERAIFFEYVTGENLRVITSNDGNYHPEIVTLIPWSPLIDTWYHVALVRTGTKLDVYVDGTLLGTHTCHTTLFNSNSVFMVGDGDVGNDPSLHGYLDEFRISK